MMLVVLPLQLVALAASVVLRAATMSRSSDKLLAQLFFSWGAVESMVPPSPSSALHSRNHDFTGAVVPLPIADIISLQFTDGVHKFITASVVLPGIILIHHTYYATLFWSRFNLAIVDWVTTIGEVGGKSPFGLILYFMSQNHFDWTGMAYLTWWWTMVYTCDPPSEVWWTGINIAIPATFAAQLVVLVTSAVFRTATVLPLRAQVYTRTISITIDVAPTVLAEKPAQIVISGAGRPLGLPNTTEDCLLAVIQLNVAIASSVVIETPTRGYHIPGNVGVQPGLGDGDDIVSYSKMIDLVGGSHLVGFLTWEPRYVISKGTAPFISSLTRKRNILVANLGSLQADPFLPRSSLETTSLRILMGTRPRQATYLEEFTDFTVFDGLATFGGLRTFVNGTFAFLFGANIIYFLFRRRPLSALGLVHCFQRRSLARKWNEDSPALHTEGGQPGSESAGIVAFLRERLVDLEDEETDANRGSISNDIEAQK
ncbi:hypothetical protein C8J57DRAFT_1628296 [Mycena rebaudengoi]|nr:hypothetical protein C8J57DRAFT_1628296 [Mycena rebaudengoi]